MTASTFIMGLTDKQLAVLGMIYTYGPIGGPDIAKKLAPAWRTRDTTTCIKALAARSLIATVTLADGRSGWVTV